MPFSEEPQGFKYALESSSRTHQLIDFEVSPGNGGDYTLYAVYVEEGTNPMTDGLFIQRSNLAMAETTLSNDPYYSTPRLI